MNKKTLAILNITLILTALVLFVHLVGAKIPTIGQASYWIDGEDNLCVGVFQDQKSILNSADQCCLGMAQQLKCENFKQEITISGKKVTVDKKCHTGKSTVEYWTNNKQYNYCQKEGYLGYSVF